MTLFNALKPYLVRYRTKLLTGLTLIVVATLFQIATPLLLKIALDALEGPRPDTGRFILTLALAVASFALIRAGIQFAGRYLIISTSRRIEYDLRNDVFAHLQKLPPSYYDTHYTGDITSRVINDIEGIRNMIGMGLQATTNISLVFIFSVTSMALLDWRLTLLALAPLAFIAAIAYGFTRRIHERSMQVQEQLAAISTKAHENFSGIRIIKTLAHEEGESRHFRRLCADYRDKAVSLVTWQNGMSGLFTFFIEVGLVITLLVGGKGIIDGHMTRGTLIAFAAYQFMLIWPMIAFGWILNLIQRGRACLERIGQVLQTAPALEADPPAARWPERPDIEFRRLNFSYGRDRSRALTDITVTIPYGTHLCIVGHTGAGKTTLAKMILKLYPAPEGTLFVGGTDIRHVSARDLRDRIGVVPQDPFLFSDTLRENIAFGIPGPMDERIDGAAQSARIAGDIAAFPDRYDQIIGERGITLSGGQKQRLALARALIKDPAILILDDPFSSVDVETEMHIVSELKTSARGRTMILITHRLSAAKDADLILVMDEGRIVESGTHEDLIGLGGLYTTLVEKQKIMAEISGPGGETL